MGKWSTYQRRGTPSRVGVNCPVVSRPEYDGLVIDSGAIDYEVTVPGDSPSDWFLVIFQSADSSGPWALINSQPVLDGDLIASADISDGLWFKVIAAQNSDGTGCISAENIAQAT